ncbi:MAG: polysaccharide deacetylase family protein [Terrimicrobiaceae bacterium]
MNLRSFSANQILPLLLAALAFAGTARADEPARIEPPKNPGIGLGIVVRTTECVTQGGWVWLLNQCEALGVGRIDLLVKQDEDHFRSERTGETLQSGELLVPLPGETTAKGWENADWLREMMAEAKKKNIQIWAWWPCFHDADAAARFPHAAYSSERNEKFVDPGFPEVRERQEELLAKLLQTYPFDGVSLDWIRYEGWLAGKNGPLAKEFQRRFPSFEWTDTALQNDYSKARWHEARAKLLTDWTRHICSTFRTNHPGVRWGAFLQPWQFTETGVDYNLFGKSGLDFLEPMAYWGDWNLKPEWVGEDLLAPHAELLNGTSFWPTLGIDLPKRQNTRALASIPRGLVSGLSWFTFGSWEQRTFNALRDLIESDPSLRILMGYEQPPKIETPMPTAAEPQKPLVFPKESSVWALVCLSELYRTNSINDQSMHPVVPVLAMHSFLQGAPGTQNYKYKTTTAYLDALLDFIQKSGFRVCQLSRLQSYMITRDPFALPARPLVITLDDGSKSVREHFHPRATERSTPYTLALVTSWLGENGKRSHATNENGKPDEIMTWEEAREINQSGLAEFISHSDAMHYHTADKVGPDVEGTPAETTRQFLLEFNRPETNQEYERRIRLDMTTSRLKFQQHGFRVPTVFCWPYGKWNHPAKQIAEESGFTHFLLFNGKPVFATAANSFNGIPRLPVMQADESLPLEFPEDPAVAQSWWLAFLKVGRDSRSVELLRATLEKLTPENRSAPAAQIAEGIMDFLRGDSAAATSRLAGLREIHAKDAAIVSEIAAVLQEFSPDPLLPPAHP